MAEPFSPRVFGLLFLAGGCGVLLRVELARILDARFAGSLAHAGTLAVNLAGCLTIGVLSLALTQPGVRLVWIGGFLGAFTTYSSFALLSVELGAEGRFGAVAVQILAHLLGGTLAVWAGRALWRALV